MPAASGNRRFSVLYKGNKIGAHTVLYSSATGETRINTEIHLLVKVAFFTVFKFSHRFEESWRDGQLMSLNSERRSMARPSTFRARRRLRDFAW